MPNAVISPLGMSDEELMNIDPSVFLDAHNATTEPKDEVKEQSLVEETPETSEDASENEATEVDDTGEEQEETQENDDEGTEEDPEATQETESEETEAPASDEQEAPIDYEAEYKALMAPFKANGREIKVKSRDDAIALMQMGANYNQKMAGLKPYLKILKMLEKQSLLDENELGYLIDLKQKKPGAIEKLLKDSNIDPMDLDAENADQYKPGDYSVKEAEIELDQVIEEIKDSPTFTRTVDIVSNKWDARSKEELAKFPAGLKIINTHMESGIYDLIMQEVEYERSFNRLQGLSDLEAYRQVGDMLQARGAFNHLGRQATTEPVKPKVVVPNPKKEEDSKLRQKRRAASPTKTGGPGTVKQEFNPLSLPDDEFEKLSEQRFL